MVRSHLGSPNLIDNDFPIDEPGCDAVGKAAHSEAASDPLPVQLSIAGNGPIKSAQIRTLRNPDDGKTAPLRGISCEDGDESLLLRPLLW